MDIFSLFFTDEGFRIDGISYAKIPIIVTDATMEIAYLPTEYLIYRAVVVGRSRSPLTWKALGYIMTAFLNYMVQHGFDWANPGEEQLAHYRNDLERRGLGRPHIRRVMETVCAFYDWAHKRGHVTSLPVTYEMVEYRSRGMLAHATGSRITSRAVLLPKVIKDRRFPRFFSIPEQALFLSAVGERDRLIYEWALYTGAREHEICNLLTAHIPPHSAYRSRRRYSISVIRKGGQPGDLWVPTWLLDKTYQYIKFGDRRFTVNAAQKRGTTIPDNIFLGRWGTALKPNSLYKRFTQIIHGAGLKGTFHDCRHTFAICTLDALMKARESGEDDENVLLILRDLMGHKSVETTQIYLRARKHYLDAIESGMWEIPA